jgi:hypothetical protein
MAEKLIGSTLPYFRTATKVIDVDGEDRVLTKLVCMRRECGECFYIDTPITALTAPCPHCFKVSRFRQPEGEL